MPVADGFERFQGRFQLVSLEDGQPISGQAVRVRSTRGQRITGTTDAEGYTQWVERAASEFLAFDFDEKSACSENLHQQGEPHPVGAGN